MDLKDISNKEHLDKLIAEVFADYTTMLHGMTNNEATYKKAALIYYWLRDYKNYLKNESQFTPNYLPSFQRGNIVNVNLGFNLGSELGGLHYGIVLADSPRNNPNIVIAPLTSVKKGKEKLHKSELFLGEELFFKIQGKYTALKTSIPNEIKLLSADYINRKAGRSNDFDTRLVELRQRITLLEKTMHKLQALKHGSIAVLNQIRAVSKMRVSDPTDVYDILYGLKLSAKALNALDDKIIELYVHKKALTTNKP